MPINKDGPLEFRVHDVLRLRKPHPCGSFEWEVYRLGADIGVKCLGCQRRVMLPRKELERRMKVFVSRPDVVPESSVAEAGEAE
ncbi:MAG: DUF951 domain-containing protein [Thermomicrobiales bacterium]|jgi:hypothetical protein|nr:DUF951 domain-containing protein [Thermomicrobiales bacterium]